jgi:ribose transport system ATP-binding protein
MLNAAGFSLTEPDFPRSRRMTSSDTAGPAPRAGASATAALTAGERLLTMQGVSKQFGGTRALADAGIHVDAGEIVALLGENGAGKSTLIKVLAGVHTPDTGRITYRDRDLTHAVRRLPVAFIHQDLGLIEWMTVAENISLMLGFPRRFGLIDWGAVRARARRALEMVGAGIDPDRRVHDLTRTEKSIVAIARALAADAEVLVLDEPTASLPADEVARLFVALRRLRSRGVGMIYVSHRLDEVFEIADRMVVLRDGRVVGERRVSCTTPEEAILLIVGREPSLVFRRPARKEGAARLVFEGMTTECAGPIDCRVHGGEVVGLVGLRSAGQETIGRALFGLTPVTGGRVRLDGAVFTPVSPRAAIAAGINLVCADRAAESIVPGLSIRENLFLNPVAAGARLLGYLRPGEECRSAIAIGEGLGLRPNDPALTVDCLSGGNQQKVVVGRWLHLDGKVYIFEDPTAGVDVGAKAEIYRLFDVALGKGATILIVSTDFEEVAKVCHRALVFDRGQVVAEFSGGDLCVENLLAAASARVGHAHRTPDAVTEI